MKNANLFLLTLVLALVVTFLNLNALFKMDKINRKRIRRSERRINEKIGNLELQMKEKFKTFFDKPVDLSSSTVHDNKIRTKDYLDLKPLEQMDARQAKLLLKNRPLITQGLKTGRFSTPGKIELPPTAAEMEQMQGHCGACIYSITYLLGILNMDNLPNCENLEDDDPLCTNNW